MADKLFASIAVSSNVNKIREILVDPKDATKWTAKLVHITHNLETDKYQITFMAKNKTIYVMDVISEYVPVEIVNVEPGAELIFKFLDDTNSNVVVDIRLLVKAAPRTTSSPAKAARTFDGKVQSRG